MHPLPCNVSGGQRDVSGSQWCSWDDDKTLSLCLSLLEEFDLLYALKKVDRVILIFAHVLE